MSDELAFWRRFLTTGGGRWPGDYARRTDPHKAKPDELLAGCIERLPGSVLCILDVGAGPLTKIGMAYPGRELRITPIDPLADAYDELLEEAGIVPTVRTRTGSGERLLERFDAETFDIAFARNAIDHGLDPARSVANMFEVVVPGGFVVLRHFRNEAEAARYKGFHIWNLDERGGDLVAWRRDGTVQNVTGPLRGGASEISCWAGESGVFCVVRKKVA